MTTPDSGKTISGELSVGHKPHREAAGGWVSSDALAHSATGSLDRGRRCRGTEFGSGNNTGSHESTVGQLSGPGHSHANAAAGQVKLSGHNDEFGQTICVIPPARRQH
jgi:hypothetical protein